MIPGTLQITGQIAPPNQSSQFGMVHPSHMIGGCLTGYSTLAEIQNVALFPGVRRHAGMLAPLTDGKLYQLGPDLTTWTEKVFGGGGSVTDITGNAGSATILQTARTIGITGDLTWTSPLFNGSANVTAASTLATVNSNVGTFGSGSLIPVLTVNAKGLITAVSTTAVLGGGGGVLDGLSDVTITDPQPGDSLVYDGTVWANQLVTSPIVTFYKFNSNTTADVDPNVAHFSLNAATRGSTTVLHFDNQTDTGTEVINVVKLLQVGDTVFLQSQTNPDRYVRFMATAVPVLKTGYWNLPVSVVLAPSGSEWVLNERIACVFRIAAIVGPEGGQPDIPGNAATATKLLNARTIGMTGDMTWSSGLFDGSANVTAASTLATVNANVGSFGSATLIPTFTVNAKGLLTAAGTVALGNAPSATVLNPGRTIGMTGDVTWTSPTFTGSANVTAASTLATVNANVGSFGSSTQMTVLTVNAKGLITAASQVGIGNAPTATLAATATALATGRTISITGDLAYTSGAFDGTAAVTGAGTLATVNANVGSFGSSTLIPTFTVNAKGLVTAAGTVALGNAPTATALATGRTIGITGDLVWTSPSFTGAANVTAAGTLATVNSNVGTFGSATLIPVITANAKGLVTAVSTVSVSGGSSYDPYVYKSGTGVQILNTVVETSMFPVAITIPGGTLATDGEALSVVIPFKWLNNSGAVRTLTFKVKIGATVVFEEVTTNLATATTLRIGAFRLNLMRNSATTVSGGIEFSMSSATSVTTGLGDFAVVATYGIGGFEAESWTWANDTTLDVTCKFSNAAATIQLDTYGATIRK